MKNMPTQTDRNPSQRFTLRIAGLSVPDEQKAELEKAADDAADKVDAENYLDPLDAQPAILFDPS